MARSVQPLPEPDLADIRASLVRAVGRVCPEWLSSRRDDLVQEALLRVVDVLRRHPERELNQAYLRRAAYSALVDEIRRHRRRRESSLDDDEGAPAYSLSSDVPDPETASAGRQLGGAIQDCLGGLVAPRRHAVVLHLQGHGGPDISRLLGWNTKRTNNLVYRALDDLRRCLGGKGYGS